MVNDNSQENENGILINEENDENELLLKPEKNDKNDIMNDKYNYDTPTPNPTPTPTPNGQTPENDLTLISNSALNNNSNDEDDEKNTNFNKNSKEEKLYKNRMNRYKNLFNEGKLNELEQLIDNCNENSSSIDYKFNFTFDKYKYDQKQISYIVRCVDNKNDNGKSEEESDVDPNPRIEKYKREKNQSIKPLFELLEEERKEILELPESFLKLSLENKKFQKLLQICKNDISMMSKAFGHKKDQVLEDENSSQSSQSGFDSGLLKKNRIEEIRSNALKNISNFYTLKYIRIIISLIIISCFFFSILYVMHFATLNSYLINSFNINTNLFEITLFTTQLINIFISLRVLYQKYIIKNITDFDFFDSLTDTNINNISESNNNILYYNGSVIYALTLYKKAYNSISNLEMGIPKYLNENELRDLFWDRINISYISDDKIYQYFPMQLDDSFPLSLAQILSNIISFLEDQTFNSITEIALEKYNTNINKNNLYFSYMTHLIIENAYNNILPNLFEKISIIPNILSRYNIHKKKGIKMLTIFYAFIMALLFIGYFFLFYITSKSMTDGMEKVTKIRLEKIEETIKKIKLFGINLRRYRDKKTKNFDENKSSSELSDNENNQNLTESKNGLKDAERKNKLKQDTSIVSNNGFNLDYKRYTPLTILNWLIWPQLFCVLIIFFCLIPVYIMTSSAVQNVNKLFLVEKYIYEKLIKTSTIIIEIKCYMSECETENSLDYNKLVNMSLIQNIINGINYFPGISKFYNEKFLLNACGAAMNEEEQKEKYLKCLSDPIILSANNTDNLIKLIEINVDYIKKEYEIRNSTEPNYQKRKLFNSTYFSIIEYILYSYILDVGDNFKVLLTNDLYNYLNNNGFFVSFLVIIIGIIAIFYCIILGIYIIKKFIYYLSISSCIMKIIPISVIINTQELENWIENKY